MSENYTLQPPPVIPPGPQIPSKQLPKMLMIGGIVLGLVIVFILGLLLGKGTSKSASVALQPTPTPVISQIPQTSPSPTIVSEVPPIQFLPGKQYFDDTYVVVSQDTPHQTLTLSVSRIEQQRDFTEYTKVNYYDGTTWNRKTTLASNPSNDIVTNPLLRGWNMATVSNTSTPVQLATIQLPDQIVSFASSDLQNEISVQSLPGSTKFIYQGKGTLTIGGDSHPAYVFYSRSYSFNAADLSYLTKPDQLISDWMLFWDKEGSFYYLDDHRGADNSSAIPSFRIGVREDAHRTVVRTPSVTGGFQTKDKVISFQTTFDTPIFEEVFLPLQNSLNKSDKKTYSWMTASGEGSIVKREGRSVGGIGVVEYIRQN